MGVWCRICDHVYNLIHRHFCVLIIFRQEKVRSIHVTNFDVWALSDMNRLSKASDRALAIAAAHPQYGLRIQMLSKTLQVIQRIAGRIAKNIVVLRSIK